MYRLVVQETKLSRNKLLCRVRFSETTFTSMSHEIAYVPVLLVLKGREAIPFITFEQYPWLARFYLHLLSGLGDL